jgi:hypothetical protein
VYDGKNPSSTSRSGEVPLIYSSANMSFERRYEMKKRAFVWVSLLMGWVVFGCSHGKTATQPGMQAETKGGKPPVITSHFSPTQQGMVGDVIKVYIAAEDPDGDMEKIAVEVNQFDYGIYPTSWTHLKPKYYKKFVGYLQWDTFSPDASRMPDQTRMTISIIIFDKAGNQSKTVVVPYRFITGGSAGLPLPDPFNQGKMSRIGWIDVDLVNPEEGVLSPR